MNKKRLIAILKGVSLIALFLSAIIAIVLSIGASVAWITGWTLTKSAMAVVVASLVTALTQVATKDL